MKPVVIRITGNQALIYDELFGLKMSVSRILVNDTLYVCIVMIVFTGIFYRINKYNMKTLEQHITLINEGLAEIKYPENPEGLFAPIQYVLSLGGKRIRPALTLMACDLFGGDIREALHPAMGIEIFHNFTLLHDDVMDKADVRRGKPTVHLVWNENTAILSGDAMQILAYKQMGEAPKRCLGDVMRVFTKTALEICEGQQYDMEFETRQSVGEDDYLDMIRLKTAVLLGGALEIGAIVAGASAENARLLYGFGENVGLAFQLKDDLLDVYGDPRVFGKNTGGDIVNNKKTYMLINAMRISEQDDRKILMKWLDQTEFDRQEKINAVTAIYDRLNIRKLCEQKMDCYYKMALDCLSAITLPDDRKEPLLHLAAQLMDRAV